MKINQGTLNLVLTRNTSEIRTCSELKRFHVAWKQEQKSRSPKLSLNDRVCSI